MKFMFWVAVIILFITLILPSLRFVFARLLFALYLLAKKIFCKDFDYKYTKRMSVFTGRQGSFYDVAIFLKEKVFVVKFCGFFRKNTDVIVNNENQWQIDTYIFTGPFLPGTKSTKAEGFFFDADAAKAEFSDKDAESVILLLPKPKCFGIRNGKETQWLDSGDEINGSTVATFRYFRKHLKELI